MLRYINHIFIFKHFLRGLVSSAEVSAERAALEVEAERLGYIKSHLALKPPLGFDGCLVGASHCSAGKAFRHVKDQGYGKVEFEQGLSVFGSAWLSRHTKE